MAFDRKSFIKRAVIVLTGGPVLLYIFYAGGYLLLGLLVIVSSIGLWEYYQMAVHKGYTPAKAVGIGATVVIYIIWYLGRLHFITLVLLAILLATFLIQARRSAIISTVENTAITMFGLFYCTALPAHLLWFQVPGDRPGIPEGRYWLVTVILLIWTFDIFSYLIGSWLGKHKLFPHISPHKSWEGLLGGVAGLVAVFILLVHVIGIKVIFWDYGAVPLLTGLSALGGDVFESVLKRDTGIKDSSSLLPGHGGVLDRFDAVFMAGPVLYWYLYATRWFMVGGGA
jgi:phosphatidate cytidylyltransferase